NTLRGTTHAGITDSEVDTADNVTVGADRSGVIETLAAGAAVASSVGVQGSVAVSTFADVIRADVSGGSLHGASVEVIAQEDVQSTTAAGGVAGGGTAAVGASVATLVSENSTTARIGSSAAGVAQVDGSESVAVRADSKELHNTTVMTAAASGTVGVAGSVGIKVVNSDTTALIDDNSLINQSSNGNVEIDATSHLATTGAAGAVGVGVGAAGVGAGLDLTVLNGQTTAMIGNGANVSGANVTVNAEAEKDIASFTVAAGGGFVGVGGAVSVVHVGGGEMDSRGKQALGQQSYEDAEGNTRQDENIADYANSMINRDYSNAQVVTTSSAPAQGDTLALIGAATVHASDTLAVSAHASHDVDVSSGALAGGVVGAGAGISSVSYESHTTALTDNASLSGGNAINVTAKDEDRSSHRAVWQLVDDGVDPGSNLSFVDGDWFAINSVAGSGSLVGLGASIAVVNRNNHTLAAIRGGSTDSSGDILVDAYRDRHTRTLSLGAQVGAVTVGISLADVTENGDVKAVAGGNIGEQGDQDGIDLLTVRANADNRNVTKAVAASAGVVTGNGAIAVVRGDSVNSRALVADNATLHLTGRYPQFAGDDSNGADLVIDAGGTQRNDVYAQATSIAAGAAVGATEARLATRAHTDSGIGSNADVNVRGSIDQRSVLMSAEQLPDNTFRSLNNVRAEGVSGALLAGVSSTVAISEQDQSSSIGIGSGSVVNASVGLYQHSDVVGYGRVTATGGAVAGIASVGVISAENRDDTRSVIDVGDNASITAQAMMAYQRALGYSVTTTRGLAGAIASANVVQNTRNLNDEVSARYRIGDGATIGLSNDFNIDQFGVYVAYANALGTSGGLSAVNTVNATVDVNDLAAEVSIGDADIKAAGLDFHSHATQSLYTDFTAEAYGGNGVADVTVNTALDSRSAVDIAAGALLEAQRVKLVAETHQPQYSVTGLAKVGAATGSTVASITNNINSDAEITLAATAEIAGSNITLTADDNADENSTNIQAKIENTSASFFLGGENLVDNQHHNARIQLDGNLVGTSAFGRSVYIESFGQYTLLNGAYAPWLREEDGEGRTVLADIAPEGSASVRIDAGDGRVDGSGRLLNQAHFFTDVTIEGSSRIGDVRLTGTPQDLGVTLVRGSGSFDDSVIITDAPTGGDITLLSQGSLVLTGVVDAGTGSIHVRNEPNGGSMANAPALIADGGSLWARDVSLDMGLGRIGGEDAALAINLRDGLATDAAFSASGSAGVYVDLALHGADNSSRIEQAVIGDVLSAGAIVLNLLQGQRLDGSSATALYRINGNIESRGSVVIDAADSAELVLDGRVASGPAAGAGAVYVNILDGGEIDSNWDGLYTSVTESQDDYGELYHSVTLGDISNDGGSGVVINADNLSGSGSVFGNGSALDVSINNQWQDLDTLSLININLGGSAVGVSINGNDSISSNEIDGIQVERVTGSGSNRIDLVDPYTGQLVIYGEVAASDIAIDMANGWLVQTFHGDDGAVLRADSLTLQLGGSSANVGWLANPLRVDIGSGGLSADLTGNVSLEALGDLHIKRLRSEFSTVFGVPTLLAIDAAGAVTAASDALIQGGLLEITAGGDIDLGEATALIMERVQLHGHNVRYRGDGGISDGLNLFGLTASGDAEIIDTSGAGINLIAANVAGATQLVTDGDIVATGDFGAALSIRGIDGPDGNNWGNVQVIDSNDLLLGDIRHGFNFQQDPANSYLRLTAAGDITQQAGSSLALYGRTLVNADGDIVLDQAGNDFDYLTPADAPRLTAGGAIVLHAVNGLTLGSLTAGGNLAVTVAGGDLEQAGNLRVGGDSTLQASGAVLLGMRDNGTGGLFSYHNRFDGLVSVDAGGVLQLSDYSTLNLGAVSANGFELFSSGNIIGHDVVASSGLNRFFTQYGSVVLDNSANQLGVIGGVAQQDITLVSSDALVVSPFAIDGKLTLKAEFVEFAAKTAIDGDWVGLSAPLTNHVGSLHVEAANIGTGALVKAEPLQDSLRRFSVDGEVTLVGNVIDFDHAEFAGPVNITATGPVKILNSGFDLQLGNVQASDLFLSSSGSIRG
ncbi:MAG TPA: hypothetical protein VIN71_00200, partial [Pseudomonadales bacterium]